jgi:hypothetical protein
MHYNLEQGGRRVGIAIARKGRMDEYNAEREREQQVHESRKNTQGIEEKQGFMNTLKKYVDQKLLSKRTDRSFFKLW